MSGGKGARPKSNNGAKRGKEGEWVGLNESIVKRKRGNATGRMTVRIPFWVVAPAPEGKREADEYPTAQLEE